uniref:Uncharacterized protein n=1 Tax=Setaria italica TaxID=4555 RepID=K4AN63_SETIT
MMGKHQLPPILELSCRNLLQHYPKPMPCSKIN